MANNGINIGLKSYDDLFKTDAERNVEELKSLKLSELKPYSEQPFKVVDNEEMFELVKSILEYGVLSPIIARPHPEGGYETLSGHRRIRACELAGKEEIPVIVMDIDDDTAAILLVDSNLQRENILPSEKAKAYQMKLEAMKRKAGRPSKNNYVQVEHNFEANTARAELASMTGESEAQIQRYIRLTNLIDPILQMVDDGTLAMSAAVEISYLGSKDQADLLKAIESEAVSPSIEQAKTLRKLSETKELDEEKTLSVMRKQKPEKMKITLGDDKLKKYFPKNYTKQQMEDIIIKLLEGWHRKREQGMER